MDRRAFLGTLGLLAATQLPGRKLLMEITKPATVLVCPGTTFAKSTVFTMGFRISREIMEDDMYGVLNEQIKYQQKRMRKALFQ